MVLGKRNRGYAPVNYKKKQRFSRSRAMRLRRRNRRTGGFMGQELKFYDTNAADTASVAAIAGAEVDPSTVLTLSAPAQGNGEEDRDGRRILIKSINIKGAVRRNASQTTSATYTVWLVMDTQTNAAQLNSEDVLADNGTHDELSFKNLEYGQRFKILWTKRFTLSQSGHYGDRKEFNIYKKCAIPVNFSGTAAGVASVADNSLHMIAVASDTACSIEYQSRIRFVD